MREDYQDIIDRYLRGEMTPQEAKDFEEKASTDAALREQLEFTRLAASAIGSRESKMRKIKQWEGEDKGKMRYWISGIAAAVVILLAGGTYSILMRNNQVQEPIRGGEQVFAIDTTRTNGTKDITENQDSSDIDEDDEYTKICAGTTYTGSDLDTATYEGIDGFYSVNESLVTFTPEPIIEETIKEEPPQPAQIETETDTVLKYFRWDKNTLEGFPYPSRLGAPHRDDSSMYKLIPSMMEVHKFEKDN